MLNYIKRKFKSRRAKKHIGAIKNPSEYAPLLDDYDEEEIVPEGRIVGMGTTLSEGEIEANKARDRFMRIYEDNPFIPFENTLAKALTGMKTYLDSRIGTKAITPLKDQLEAIMNAYQEVDKAYKKLHLFRETPDPEEKKLKKYAKSVNDNLDSLEENVEGVVGAIRKTQKIFEDHIKAESKANISRHYGNLHPRTVMVFAGLEKANTYLSIGIGAVATLVGHPEVGVTIKGAISGLLTAAKTGTRFVQEQMDFRDEETVQEAQPLISHDERDVLTVDNVKKAYSVATTVTKKALDLAGVDTSFIDEINKYVNGFDTAVNNALTPVFEEIKQDVETGTFVDSGVDMLAGKAQKAIKEQLKKAKEELQGVVEEKAQGVLTQIEAAIRGERRAEGMDLEGQLEDLDDILEELQSTIDN